MTIRRALCGALGRPNIDRTNARGRERESKNRGSRSGGGLLLVGGRPQPCLGCVGGRSRAVNGPEFLRDAPHVVVTRFSVPRPHDARNRSTHADGSWLDRRLELFRSFFVPSVGRLGVPAILLCSAASASAVASALADLDWVAVVEQNEWYGGWVGRPDQTLTRMDSDDAIHEGWFEAVDTVAGDIQVCCTKAFLRYDPTTGKLAAYSRGVPSPLAAFRGGLNPYAFDHSALEERYSVRNVEGAFLLQVFHGGNVSSRRPSWYRRRLPLDRLAPFGVRESVSTSKGRAI